MSALHLIAILALSATTIAAQSDQITWASVVYTFYGEKTPSITSGPYNLSPLGANQLLDAGALIRSRYITQSANGSELTIAAPINGISTDSIDNSQLYVLSTNDEFISASALAFMQGLYPPTILDPQVEFSNGSSEAFPLDGYQYPNIGTVSSLDYNYIWIAGNIDCTNYAISQIEALESQGFSAQMVSTEPFYDSLANTIFQDYDPSIINYGNAWDLYEYASYQYNHNHSAASIISSSDLVQLYNLASQQQFELNTPNIYGSIPSIAGQTLASAVLQQFQHNIASSGVADKLTLLFGSFEPMLSFFALSFLSTSPAARQFNSLPEFGSIMSFELFSYPTSGESGKNLSNEFPSSDELFVRFLFRNGTGDSAPLVSYPLFGRGNSEADMSLADFVQGMGDFSLDDVVNWCAACNSITLFCEAIGQDVTNATSPAAASPSAKKTLSPAIGGVIGATVTLALVVLIGIVLGLIGFRLDYHEKNAKVMSDVGGVGVLKRSGSGTAGGFKGAEKLASDTDLRLKGGAGASVIRHERVGSWELNESPTSPKQGNLDKDIESGRMERVVSGADYGRHSEEVVDPFGDPVKAVDQV